MFRLAVVAVLAGCSARIEGTGVIVDAAPDASELRVDAAIADAPPDARLCAGGDAHQTAPDGSCLVLFQTPQSWDAGRVTCTGITGHLAILTTAALDNTAEALVGNLDTFIGLTDAVKGWDDRPCAPNGTGAGQYAVLCQF
jgi:hypothetical protein